MEPWDNVHWLPLCLTNVSLHSCLQLSDNKKNLPKNCVTWTSFTDLNHRPVSSSFLDSFDFLCSTGENQMNTKRWLFTDQCSFCTLRWLFESLLVFSVCISVCFVGIFSSCPFPLVSLTFCIFGRQLCWYLTGQESLQSVEGGKERAQCELWPLHLRSACFFICP